MQSTKLTQKLAERLEGSDPSEMFELILELDPLFNPIEEATSLSKTERIAFKKAAFDGAVAPVANAIREAGGEVTGEAWINQTLRASVPASAVRKLADLEMIASLDTPNSLEMETR